MSLSIIIKFYSIACLKQLKTLQNGKRDKQQITSLIMSFSYIKHLKTRKFGKIGTKNGKNKS